MSLILIAVAYSIYLFPILIFDEITNTKTFVNNSAFLIATFSVALIWRMLNQKSLVNGLGLQFELNQEKLKLENYSQQLEHLVQERTKELSISEKWYRAIYDNANDGIIICNAQGVIVNVNQSVYQITGLDAEDLIGHNIEGIEGRQNINDHRERMSRILNDESLIYEFDHIRKDGSKVIIEVSSRTIGIAGEQYVQSFYRDITEKKIIQEQLLHSQKMESIGILAGGVAHNFNNILSAILGYAELLLEFSDLDEASRQKVINIENSARKAGMIVAQMMRFARRESHEVLPINLHDVILDTVKLFEGASRKNIKLRVNLDTHEYTMKGDPNQIEQVLMNLLVNAKDAMPDGGFITISTHQKHVDVESNSVPAYITPGQYVVLSVSDTGTGIHQDILAKIYDPFFTTKEKGKGTGLGLATVYGIVKDHNGYVDVRTIVGEGTTFDIYFPMYERSKKVTI
jgi:PAS domain S-box-containing protein